MSSQIRHKLIFIARAVIAATMIISCNKSKNGGGQSAPPAPPPIPLTCPPGQVMTNAGCTIQGVVPINMGPIQYYSSMNDRFNSSGNNFRPESSYSDFLQNALGVCERCVNSYGEALQCSTWENGFNMIRLEFIQGISNKMRVHFYSTPILQNNYFTYAWNFPNIEDFFIYWFTGAPPPSCNPGQYAPYWYGDFSIETTNSSQGFVLYGQGPYLSKWNRHVIRIYVDTGKIGDPNFNYRVVAYTPTNEVIQLASGSFSRCQSQNCGLY